MNYDLITWIEYFIGAFICCFGMLLTEKILLEKNFKNIKFIRFLLMIPFTIFIIFNTLVFDNIVKIFGSLLILFLILKFIFQEKSIESFVYSIFTYIVFIISEIIMAIIISTMSNFFDLNLEFLINKSIYTNLIICCFSVILVIIFKDKLNFLVNKLKKSNVIIFLLQSILTIFISISCINHLYIDDWNFDYNFILNSIIVIGSIFLMYLLLKQYLKNKEVVDKFQLLEDYMKTSTVLIEQYSTTNHKYKNNLIAIKGYIKSNPKEALKFVSDLLENYKDEKFKWFSSINYIGFDSIRYLICYKLSTAEEKKIKILVNVDKNLKSINTKLMNIHQISIILDILGEFFDNSIYASYESNEKEIVFNAYLENEKIVFEISNTYLGKIDLDMITKNGYTTKGKGHGFGLYEIDKNIENHSFLDYKCEIIDNYFIAKLYIALDDLKKED